MIDTNVVLDFMGNKLAPKARIALSKIIDVRRVFKIQLPDAVIAATALIHNFTLVTSNTKDFKNISGLDVINPNDL